MPYLESQDKDKRVLIGLAVSGGGSRAATFAAGALEALADLRVEDGQGQSVLEKVDYISSVSGGSLASAYYALNKPQNKVAMIEKSALSPEYKRFFDKFTTDMQTDFERPAAVRQILKLRALNSTKAAYSFAESWDEMFYGGKTLAELYTREKNLDSPRLILNGTRWNDGRRFISTTLPIEDFNPEFATLLLKKLEQSQTIPNEEKRLIRDQLHKAYEQFRPISFQNINGHQNAGTDFKDIKMSLAVASSASVPGVIGPVTYNVRGSTAVYHHIGDGGLFDNQGVETLVELFLNKLYKDPDKKALIIIIDASYPFDAGKANLDRADTALDVYKADPFRIQAMMEQRALSYQLALWAILRSQPNSILPDFDHLRIVRLRHTEAKWSGFDDLPEACRNGYFPRDVTSDQINQDIATIPTLFRLKHPCHGPLLIKAAHKVVNQYRERIVSFAK